MATSIKEIQSQISRVDNARRQMLENASRAYGELKGIVERMPAAAAQAQGTRRDKIVSLLDGKAGRAMRPWAHEQWETFETEAADEPLHMVRIGRHQEANLLKGETPFDDLPALAPLLRAQGAIIFKCDTATQAKARDAIRALVLRAATLMSGSSLFTLLDPISLGAAFPFENDLPRTRPNARSLSEALQVVLEDIQRINQRVVGAAGRFLELGAEERSGETFEFVGIVDFPKAYAREPRALEQLVKIANSGPRAGRHLIVEYNSDEPLPRDFSMDQFANAVVIDVTAAPQLLDAPPSAELTKKLLARALAVGQNLGRGDFVSLVRPERFMTESALKRIETPVGERLRFWFGIGDGGGEVAHGIIAGQVGSGKSHLMHVAITGLASRYSPDELRLYLVDGKQGVEFEIYKNLPHAAVVSLRTAPALARSVMADYHQEMKDRYALFQEVGVSNLTQYRNATGKVLPRMLMVVDEYQQILEGARDEGMAHLAPVLHQGRAAGMHLLLGSQVFDVPGMSGREFNDIHMRAALSLSQDYVQTISAFGPEGKRLIRELAPTGEIVINDEAGRDGANSRGAVARLTREGSGSEHDSLSALVTQISEAAASERRPVVLNGRNGSTLLENQHVVAFTKRAPDAADLQYIARQPIRLGGFGEENWTSAASPLGLWIGRRFDVHGHALCMLKRAPAQNVLCIGSQTEVRNAMLASALLSLPSMVAVDQLDVTILDGLPHDMPGGALLGLAAEWLGARGANVEVALDDEVPDALARFKSAKPGRIGLLIVSDPENLFSLQQGFDPYGQPSPGPAADLRELYMKGPQSSRHTIIASSSVSGLQAIMSPSRDGRFFNHRIVQQLSEDDSMSLFSSLAAARLNQHTDHPNTTLVVDQVRGAKAGVVFNAYALSSDLAVVSGPEQLRAILKTLDG